MYPESTTSEGRVYPAEATRRDRACRQVPPLLPRKRGAPLARRPVRPPAAASGCGWRLRNKFGKWVCFFLLIWQWAGFTEALAAEPAVAQAPMASAGDATNAASPLQTNAGPRFEVRAYEVTGDTLLSPGTLNSLFARHTGPNISLTGLVEAASDLQLEYRKRGYPPIGVAIALREIINGIVTMRVLRGGTSPILVSGRRYTNSYDAAASALQLAATAGATNTPAAAQTNAVPRFNVRAYEIRGDTLLSTETLTSILTKYTGTNLGVPEIMKAASDLQMEYRDRGYPTVNVTIPPQQITNGMVKFRVFQGRLSEIVVAHSRYFSSNNVMRALPSLRTNIILSSPIFQAELDRANANRDRQIYPQIEPGAEVNTTILTLNVKDRLPLHGKVELNNQSSPGTPELRINSSVVYNNLWQREHSMGVQYSFSPEEYKTGEQWSLYDLPLVANYSAFYNLPLGHPEPVAAVVSSQPGNFGYDEATRRFRLPPPSGRPEINIYASRSTIDTGLENLSSQVIYDVPGVRQVFRNDVQQDVTINEAIGARLSAPLSGTSDLRSTLSGGLDYKIYDLTSNKTNDFQFTEITVNENGRPNPPIVSKVASPVPETRRVLDYLPLSLRYEGSLRDRLGLTSFGMGISGNAWYSGSLSNLQSTVSSSRASGNWVILSPRISRDIVIYTNWTLSLQADGQWASAPLISNEQYGIGVASVRGYREGEVFGDTGWRVSLEQKTPPHVVGIVYGKTPLTIRGSLFMDYAETYLLDPQGRQARVPLWSTGFGAVASVGFYWEARLLVAWPLESTLTTEAGPPRFHFAITAQF